MICRACSSENPQNFSGELTVAPPEIKRLSLSPVYICINTLFCLDCGYAEIAFPATQLEELREDMERFSSKVA